MSEEIELNEGDLVVPAPSEFSMFDMLDGVEYPEEEVTVALNEKAAHRLANVMREIRAYQDQHPDESTMDEEKVNQFRKDVADLRDTIEKSKMTFYLKGISDDLLTTAGSVAEEKFEDRKKEMIGAEGIPIKVLPQAEKMAYMRYMNAVTYSMFIQRFVRHSDGAVRTTPSPDEIAAFMDKAPEAAKGILVRKIQELRVKSADYEANLDEGFFQKS